MSAAQTCDSTQSLAALGYLRRSFTCYDLDDQGERSLLRTFQRFSVDEVQDALEHFKAISAHWPLPAQLEKHITEQRAQKAAGARDRVRKRNYGEPVDLSVPIPADLKARVDALRECVQEPAPTTRPPRFVIDRDNLRVVPPEIYAAAEEGRRQFQENRRARLDAAK